MRRLLPLKDTPQGHVTLLLAALPLSNIFCQTKAMTLICTIYRQLTDMSLLQRSLR